MYLWYVKAHAVCKNYDLYSEIVCTNNSIISTNIQYRNPVGILPLCQKVVLTTD